MDPEIVPSTWPHFPVIPVISHNHSDKACVLDRWILGNYHGMQPHGVTGVMPHVNERMQRAFSKNCLHEFNWYPAVQAQMGKNREHCEMLPNWQLIHHDGVEYAKLSY
ncbi:hypothetical protein B0H10DRAFT_1967466 [Mycena sp. CBHHK59/15]|nr:hypothetical protein B0H10DRAFT_1967466 [Mycena sp. CBHHK59/15]